MKKAILIIALYVIMQMVCAYIFTIVGKLLTNITDTDKFIHTSAYFWTLGVCLLAVNIVMVVLVYVILNRDSLHSVSFYLKIPRKRDIVLSILTFIPLIFLINGIGELIYTPKFIQNAFTGMTSNWLCLFCGVIISPIAEEFCFRGGVLASLYSSPKYRRYALVISSFGYGLLNLTPAQVLVGFMFGMFLGWVFLRTQSLLVPIICHIVNNIIATIVSFVFGAETKMIELFPNHITYYLCLFISAVIAFMLLRLMQKHLYRSRIEEEL